MNNQYAACSLIMMFAMHLAATDQSYDLSYRDYSQKIGHEVAVLVVAYNRPHYLKECIESIENNPESNYLPIIFALDGGANATQQENIAHIQNSSIKNKIMLIRPRNYGCPKNHIDAKRFAFDWCNFKKIIVLEEDIVISPTYFSFILNAHTWATNHWENIGAMQAWSYCFLTPEEKEKKLDHVRENEKYWSFVTYCIDKKSWDTIKQTMYHFESFIDEIPHTPDYDKARSKPGFFWNGMPKIRAWVQTLVHKKYASAKKAPQNLESKFAASFKDSFLSPDFRAAQDVMMGFSFFLHDLVKLQTVVNRVIHIGRCGITTTEGSFVGDRYSDIHLDHFEQDKTLTSFTLIT